jgi:phosphatidate cytidylyltransferase
MPSSSSSAASGDTAPRVPKGGVPEAGVPEAGVPQGWAAGLRLRVISAVVMAAIVLLAILAGPLAFAAFVALGAAILAWEWTRLCGAGHFGVTGMTMALGIVAAVVLAALGWPGLALLLAVPVAALVYALARAHRPTANGAAGWVAAGVIYICVPVVALVWLRNDAGGERLILWLMAAVWATDIGAFFAGRLIGGPKLAPRISPKKTWAGLIGAMASAALVGVIADASVPGAPGAVALAAAGMALAVVAQAGDLGESWVKRRFGAKDASNLIPGHGGLLDRVDGLLAAAVALAAWQWLSSGGGVLSWR